MKLTKINSKETIEVDIKNIRLPNKDEYSIIKEYSFMYQKGNTKFNFYKEFVRDDKVYEELIPNIDKIKEFNLEKIEYYPSYLYVDECCLIDLIPIIETNNNLKPNVIYITKNNIPFISIDTNKLLCLTRVDYTLPSLIEDLDYDITCSFMKKSLENLYKY